MQTGICRTIAIANQKGGVGKTTTAFNLGYNLAKKGRKTLLVDFDPQGNLSLAFGIESPDELNPSINDLLNLVMSDEELPERETFIHRHRNGNLPLDIVPSNIKLVAGERNLVNAVSGNTTLRELLAPLKESYDNIIIDTNPFLGMLTINALTACDEVVIPVSLQLWSATGLQDLIQTINMVRKKLNPGLTINGILMTMGDERTNLCRAAQKFIVDQYGRNIRIFGTSIPHSTKVGEANYVSSPVSEQNPTGKAALAYEAFAEEVLLQK